MSSCELRELKQRAKTLGVQTAYVDVSGTRKEASVETLRAMIELLGGAGNEVAPIPPVIVCWNGNAKTVRATGLVTVAELHAPLSKTGERVRQSVSHSSGILRIPKLPFGYYDLRLQVGRREYRSLVISAPSKAFSPRAMRDWGVFVPMYALRSESNWGAGNLTDWERLCERLARENGTRGTRSSTIVVATLPLLGAFLEEWKCEPSPYSPATRLFWNEFFLDVTRTPEFAASKAARKLVNSPAFRREISALRRGRVVDYLRGMRLKRRVLDPLANEFFHSSSPRHAALETFLKQRPELERYAAFRATCEARRESWESWPQRMHAGDLRASDYDERTKRYFIFAQWLAQEQMDSVLASSRERGVKLYLDLPLGVNPDGYDVWANQNLFVNEANVGAPPDAFFTKGQDWGFSPLHPQRARADGYRYVIDYLRFQMRHTGLLRIDHVMGMHRLWWVPRGASAADGAYVSYTAEEFYAILCLESHRHQTVLVGENLGTVPPEVNRAMARHGLRTMYVAQYEMQPNAKQPLRRPPRDCVASINTHDMPAWAAHWRGLDIADRQQLGLLRPKEVRAEKRRRAELRKVLVKFLRRKKLITGSPNARNVLAALLTFLSRSEAELVLVNLEDLWLETEPQNTPGTSTERVNWRRKARYGIEELTAREMVMRLLRLADRGGGGRD